MDRFTKYPTSEAGLISCLVIHPYTPLLNQLCLYLYTFHQSLTMNMIISTHTMYENEFLRFAIILATIFESTSSFVKNCSFT